jgi:hypothetical protein
VKLRNERICGDPGEPTMAASRQPLANLLENHATLWSAALRTSELTEEGTGIVDWMFPNRKIGRITLAQLPNWPLGGVVAGVTDDVAGTPPGLGTCSPGRPQLSGPCVVGGGG